MPGMSTSQLVLIIRELGPVGPDVNVLPATGSANQAAVSVNAAGCAGADGPDGA